MEWVYSSCRACEGPAVVRSARYLYLSLCFSLCFLLPAHAATNWRQPTPEELSMTSDPAAPDAPAVFLFREEIVDDKLHFHRVYARIKILNEKGKEQFSDIEIPYDAGGSNIRDVEGRTIHSDGTVIPFTGKPYSKELVKSGNLRIMAKVFSMPDVQVGSILEYQWELQYDDAWVKAPDWQIQQSLFVHKGHFHFVPFDMSGGRYITVTDALGKENPANQLLFYQALPIGTKVREGMDGFDLNVENIPALPEEAFSPPLSSFAYRVIFYYSPQMNGGDFWKYEAKIWSKDVDRFVNPSDKIHAAVAQIVAPSDTEDQKLQKIYSAVMKLENTRFSRERSAQENKAEGLRIKTAADIWEQKRGSDDELNRLFLSLARAAGFKAWDMIVTERDRNILNGGYLYWGQFEDEISIVNVGGKEVFFDPGQRYCTYGKLHWMHTQVMGIRQTESGTAVMTTPPASYSDTQVLRTADLRLAPDGDLKGTIRVTMTGVEALRWRQKALRDDEDEAKKELEGELQDAVPAGVHVKMDHIIGLTDETSVLMAVADVSGSMGSAAGKRILLPSAFFQASVKPLFPEEKRESPVDLRFPYIAQDKVDLKLAPGLAVDSVPTKAQIDLPKDGEYKVSYNASGDVYEQDRIMALGTTLYKKEEYSNLRDFFQKISAQDQQQIVLKRAAIVAE